MSEERSRFNRYEIGPKRGPTDDTQSTVWTETSHNQQSELTDTIDDWETVLTETGNPTVGAETDANGTPPTESASTTDVVRIDPISDSTLEAAVDVLPKSWLEDTDIQRLIQWVVYTFVEETNSNLSTGVRFKNAIDRVAAQADISSVPIRRVCTNHLYRDRSGSAKRNFQSDLQTIESRIS